MAHTIADVAVLAGVSPSTVSRSLRGMTTISAATRTKVLAAAAELGFSIDPAGQRLATGRTSAIGVVVPYVVGWYFSQAITGLDQVLRAAGYDLLLYNLGDTEGRARLFSRMPLRRKVDGVVVLALPMEPAEQAVLESLEVPMVMVGAAAHGFGSVTIDDEAVARTAMRHLVNLGHRRIGVLAGNPDHPMHFSSVAERLRGVRSVMDSVEGRAGDPGSELIAYSDLTVDGGGLAMAELMSIESPPTAVFAMSDEMAFGAMKTARRMGLSIPGDVSVIGVDDHSMADLFDLTTIRQPVVEQGAQGARLLLEAIQRGQGTAPMEIVVDTTLVVRGSTAPPGRERSPVV